MKKRSGLKQAAQLSEDTCWVKSAHIRHIIIAFQLQFVQGKLFGLALPFLLLTIPSAAIGGVMQVLPVPFRMEGSQP